MCVGAIEKIGKKSFRQDINLPNVGGDLKKVVQAG